MRAQNSTTELPSENSRRGECQTLAAAFVLSLFSLSLSLSHPCPIEREESDANALASLKPSQKREEGAREGVHWQLDGGISAAVERRLLL